MALTKIDDRGLKTPIDLLDNEKIRFGTGNDLELYHDGSHSYINESGTGNLRIKSDNSVLFETDNFTVNNEANSENLLLANNGGSVKLYYDNSEKIRTESYGLNIVGSNHLQIGDNGEIRVGNSGDLKIYHDGSNSYITDAGTGSLRINSNDARIINAAGSEDMARFMENGAVELYYDNSKKFETNASGVDITGTLTSDGLNLHDNQYVRLGTDVDMLIGHGGSDGFIRNDTGPFYLRSDGINIVNQGNDENYIKCIDNGAVELYYDNSKKLETASYGVDIPDTLRLSGGWADYGTQMCLGCDSNGVAYTAAYALKFNTGANNSRTTILELDASNNATFAGQIKVAAGYGLHFGANSDTGRTVSSNVLDDYEEGTWTPTDQSGAGLSFNISGAVYTKIGRMVYARIEHLVFPTTSDTNGIYIGGLPFTVGAAHGSGGAPVSSSANGQKVLADNNTTKFWMYPANSASGSNNSQMSGQQLYGILLVYEAA